MSPASAHSDTIVVEYPKAMFNHEAAKRAAYVLMRRIDVAFDETATSMRCSIRSLAEAPEDPIVLERDFRRELVDQDLRLSLEAKTQPMRDAILGLAFSRTGLQG